MMEIKSLPWNISQDEVFMDYHCSYISEEFFNKLLRKKMKQKRPKALPQPKPS